MAEHSLRIGNAVPRSLPAPLQTIKKGLASAKNQLHTVMIEQSSLGRLKPLEALSRGFFFSGSSSLSPLAILPRHATLTA